MQSLVHGPEIIARRTEEEEERFVCLGKQGKG